MTEGDARCLLGTTTVTTETANLAGAAGAGVRVKAVVETEDARGDVTANAGEQMQSRSTQHRPNDLPALCQTQPWQQPARFWLAHQGRHPRTRGCVRQVRQGEFFHFDHVAPRLCLLRSCCRSRRRLSCTTLIRASLVALALLRWRPLKAPTLLLLS